MGIPEHAYRADGKEPSNEWGTPKEVLEPIYEYFGGIALDPFGSLTSNLIAREYIITPDKHERYFQGRWPQVGLEVSPVWRAKNTQVHSGFCDEFGWPTEAEGLTFLNGPYDDILAWTAEGYNRAQSPNCRHELPSEVMLLLPSRTSSRAFQWYVSRMWCLNWCGRLKFQGAKDTATFHSSIAYLGPRPELLRKAFGKKHWIIKPGST